MTFDEEVHAMTNPRTVRLSPDDNVVIAIDAVPLGTNAAGATARERIPRGHKMAVAPLGDGEPVRKFGQIIGFASRVIAPATFDSVTLGATLTVDLWGGLRRSLEEARANASASAGDVAATALSLQGQLVADRADLLHLFVVLDHDDLGVGVLEHVLALLG